ncbi:hypothetical protein ACTXJ8_14200 [Corynebacterium variabile]|uniref:hypothetical protein n=1 Tax=Corynebacterium variabile TaxID=1727 RepID=UPI003FD082BE
MAGFKLDRNALKKLEKDVQKEIDKRTGGGIEVGPTLADTERNLKKLDKQLGTTHSTTEIKKKAKELHKEQGL